MNVVCASSIANSYEILDIFQELVRSHEVVVESSTSFEDFATAVAATGSEPAIAIVEVNKWALLPPPTHKHTSTPSSTSQLSLTSTTLIES